MLKRYLFKQIQTDLKTKMVFLGGPRQVGKTTLSLQFTDRKKGYLNWDISKDREKILKEELPNHKIWIFDELHKNRSWRNYLKGLYDANKENRQQILVPGSARLDYYRFGGDSLQGRYHYLRLYPLSVAELKISNNKDMLELMKLGGFPEPFFHSSETESKRWSREYRSRLIQEDIASIESLQDLAKLELMVMRLPELVASPLSINSLREDLQISHKTASKWLDSLERLYAIFRISPFGSPKVRSVKKEQKHYHYDWTLIKDESIRFENMLAVHLLKWVNYLQDAMGEDYDLRYFRDSDGREVDFVIIKNNEAQLFIEAKLNDTEVSKSLKYLKDKFPGITAYQLSAKGSKDYRTKNGIIVCPALNFLKSLV